MVNLRRLLQALAAALILTLPVSHLSSTHPFNLANSAASNLELVVFEADGCVYCDVLRRDVTPLYSASARSKEAPLRFFNVSRSDESQIGIASAITLAPTVVLLRDGREEGRITGYTGPEAFLRFVSLMIGRAD